MNELIFSSFLKSAREQKGWTQLKLSRELGLTQGFVNKIENGTAFPSYETCLTLENVFGVSAENLWSRVEKEKGAVRQNRFRTRGAAVRGAMNGRTQAEREGSPSLADAPSVGPAKNSGDDGGALSGYRDLKIALANPHTRDAVLGILRSLAQAAQILSPPTVAQAAMVLPPPSELPEHTKYRILDLYEDSGQTTPRGVAYEYRGHLFLNVPSLEIHQALSANTFEELEVGHHPPGTYKWQDGIQTCPVSLNHPDHLLDWVVVVEGISEVKKQSGHSPDVTGRLSFVTADQTVAVYEVSIDESQKPCSKPLGGKGPGWRDASISVSGDLGKGRVNLMYARPIESGPSLSVLLPLAKGTEIQAVLPSRGNAILNSGTDVVDFTNVGPGRHLVVVIPPPKAQFE